MSAQAEQVVASASILADMASQLEGLAGGFRIDDGGILDTTPLAMGVPDTQRSRRAA
jgi:hypothetical protein